MTGLMAAIINDDMVLPQRNCSSQIVYIGLVSHYCSVKLRSELIQTLPVVFELDEMSAIEV